MDGQLPSPISAFTDRGVTDKDTTYRPIDFLRSQSFVALRVEAFFRSVSFFLRGCVVGVGLMSQESWGREAKTLKKVGRKQSALVGPLAWVKSDIHLVQQNSKAEKMLLSCKTKLKSELLDRSNGLVRF